MSTSLIKHLRGLCTSYGDIFYVSANQLEKQAAQITHEKEMYSKAMEALSEVLEERDKLRDALITCRSSVKFDLMNYERIGGGRTDPLRYHTKMAAEEEACRLQSLLDTIDAAAKNNIAEFDIDGIQQRARPCA